ncbi:probable membrane-associated kinase regulator 2 [Nicotiana tomentosiformis]|uniref:probable membrane-associated kinase regulator 2 n=1 Tax=Nicotiana tomentosiformis TaxID=4098 RepID=UPI00051C4531|nr:probable membrane-associated kinase regulator 2 [Nicotiana tomentosiformis]
MEAFNLLKFWRNSSADTAAADRDIVSELDDLDYVRNPAVETDEETDDDEDSFFDLVFTGPDKWPKVDNNNDSKSVSVNSPRDPESPRDVFFKPKPFAIDSNSKPQSPISILKSAPMFRVFLLGFRKSKPEKVGIDDSPTASPKIRSKRFTVKCKAEEVPVPMSPVFTRDNSLRSKLQKEKEEDLSIDESLKKFVRADVPKYLKLMKPLYARASKRYTDKIGVSPLSSPSTQSMCSSPRKASEEGKQGNRVAAFGAVRKHLGKSRSAASTFAGASPSPMNRRDDSLLQEQNDGIQGAILHCKRSYSSVAKDCSMLLPRSGSEHLPRASSEELNRWSI